MSTDRHLPIAGQHPPERTDAARNRVRILAAARGLLRTHTPCDVSIDEIAAAAGVGKGTIYRRFGDRGRLMQALLDEREEAFQAAVLSGDPPLGPGAAAGERLEAFLCALVDQLEEAGDLLAEVETGQQWWTSPPQRFRRLHVRVLLAEARPDLDADPLAETLLAPLTADTYHHLRRTAGYSTERVKEATRTLTAGLLRA
ncbi:MAG TPA: TetR/AcrR family transcriptional regulator [Euzebyales bacterium]|nr:TetR/AcrR family transcriptional regulator [Euzebyales bacterium]